MSYILEYENSIYDGQPLECYKFTHAGISYYYTSAGQKVTIVTPTGDETYQTEYIKRTEISPSTSGSSSGASSIKVKRTNSIAMLWQGSPPEQEVKVEIIRLHNLSNYKYDKILVGTISLVNFIGSEAEIIVTLEGYLQKELPNGVLSYTCNNVIYDTKCKLNKEDYQVSCYLDIGIDGLYLKSTKLAEYPDDYFANGYVMFGQSVRAIIEHKGNYVKLKYPFNKDSITGSFYALAGCDCLYKTCHNKFNNTDNFTGVPYCPPTNSEKHKNGVGAYWVDSLSIRRDTNGEIGTIGM